MALVVLAHLVVVVARVPYAAWAKRLREISAHRADGRTPFLFAASHLDGADVVDRLIASTPPDAMIAYDGDRKGALEFVAALVFPRLLVAAGQIVADQTEVAGRRIATQVDADGTRRRIVVVGDGRTARLELR